MRKLGMKSDHRQSVLKNMSADMIIYGKVNTTLHRAKELQSYVEKLVTKAKQNKSSDRLAITKKITNKKIDKASGLPISIDTIREDKKSVKRGTKEADSEKLETTTVIQKLIDEVAPKYEEVNGGYTRIIKLAPRKGDNAKMAILEFTKK